MIAVIIGTSGLVGSNLIQELLQDPAFSHVISIGRRPLPFSHAKLSQIFIQDLSEIPSLAEQLKGDVYFCCLGTTIKKAGSQDQFRLVDHTAVIRFAEVAKSNHARSFVVISSKGANPHSFFFYSKIKGEMEQDLRNLHLSRLVIMRPGVLLGEREEFRLSERIAISVLSHLPLISFSTPVNVLALKMLSEGKKLLQGTFVFEAKDIPKIIS